MALATAALSSIQDEETLDVDIELASELMFPVINDMSEGQKNRTLVVLAGAFASTLFTMYGKEDAAQALQYLALQFAE